MEGQRVPRLKLHNGFSQATATMLELTGLHLPVSPMLAITTVVQLQSDTTPRKMLGGLEGTAKCGISVNRV
ncbi:unnamed protein product [Fusarium fujikuroi]|uniref:Uncharacterized protein n=1 Tax=Fusarium fujikuroi TaxID=5127 RepID=A0A2H3RXT5_FUSFU|nr:uncharacterized protein FFC1_08755 [Fusarium fujikuroi]VTT73371.1 unnamed protein product [Fusarium fujikuroi]VTT77707.1 unnamed protein product [Fusarium fujikuroi]VZI04694.1 unnamed protein product [Fusarium fujikuroi]